MSKSSPQKPWLLIGLCLFLTGCPAAAFLIPPLIQFGASLLDSAVNNYDEEHQQNMQSLLTALQQRTNPYQAQSIIAYPNNQAGGYSSPGFQNETFQAEQEYPPTQEYDPYQNSQPQYEEHAAYPNNQHENQFSQHDPYANQSGAHSQHTPMQSDPSYDQTRYPQQSFPSQPQQPPYPQEGLPYSETYGNEEMASNLPNQYLHDETSRYETSPIDMWQEANIPISLDVLLVKKHLRNGVQSYLPIKDGDVLFDGRGNPNSGDKFRVMFRANTNCYVYVIAVDGSAWAQGIFPSTSSPFANPVKAGQQYLLPVGNNWFSLDQFKGIETIFVVASHERRPDIEQILATTSGRERHPAEQSLAVHEPAIIPNGFSGAHAGSLPFTFNTSQRSRQELLPTTYFVNTAGEDLRITRWFRHQ